MIRSLSTALSGTVALALVIALSPGASAQRKKYPELIYVPTPQNVVDKMLEVAKVTKDDYVFDLGSGDGRIPITAARSYGARGFGVDINAKLVAMARANAKAAGVADRVEFRQQDLFKTSVKEATVVGLYLFVWANEKLRPRLIGELKPGSRIVAHDFPVGEDWKPDVEEEVENRTVYLWYVPAQVGGNWQFSGASQPFTVQLRQKFQMIDGSATVDGRAIPLTKVLLRGDEIDFAVELESGKPTQFRGRVAGDRIEPRAGGGAAGWSALRKGASPGEPTKPPAKSR
jgi:SAM-dependent methyltransferase